MSVKGKLKTAGKWALKHGWTLGVTWLIDRYVQGAAARLLKDAVGVIAGDNQAPNKLAAQLAGTLQAQIDRALAEKVLPSWEQQKEALRLGLEAKLAKGLARGRK